MQRDDVDGYELRNLDIILGKFLTHFSALHHHSTLAMGHALGHMPHALLIACRLAIAIRRCARVFRYRRRADDVDRITGDERVQ